MTRPAQPTSEASKWLPSGTIGFGDFPKLGGAANQIRVMIGADGKPTGCAVHWASLEQKTNDAICKAIVDKGQFHPALDAAGPADGELLDGGAVLPDAAFRRDLTL